MIQEKMCLKVPYKDDNTLEIKNLDNAKKALLKDKRKQIWTKNWLKFWSCFEKE